jgi:hypothetical protein
LLPSRKLLANAWLTLSYCIERWRLWRVYGLIGFPFGRIIPHSGPQISSAQFFKESISCGQTGGRLWKDAEVDHRVLLFRVWSDHRDVPRPKLLDF